MDFGRCACVINFEEDEVWRSLARRAGRLVGGRLSDTECIESAPPKIDAQFALCVLLMWNQSALSWTQLFGALKGFLVAPAARTTARWSRDSMIHSSIQGQGWNQRPGENSSGGGSEEVRKLLIGKSMSAAFFDADSCKTFPYALN